MKMLELGRLVCVSARLSYLSNLDPIYSDLSKIILIEKRIRIL